MRPSQLLAAAVALSSVASAWPDVFDSVNALDDVKNVIYGRQDNSKSAQPESTAEPQSTETPTDKPTATDEPTVTSKGDTKSTNKASGTVKSTRKPSATNFGADVPAGGIAMITPSVFAGPQFYKIGDWVTFAWNYTSLSIAPSAIDIMATCTANQQTYTLAVNQTVHSAHETGGVLWDTKAYKDNNPNKPLLTETYTLLIYDSNLTVSATARPGYLAVYNQFTFGMYDPQPYTPWADFQCANCIKSGALSATEKLTLKVILFTSATTVASLLYFAASFGVW